MSGTTHDPGHLGWRDLPKLIPVARDAYRRRILMESPDLTYLFWECTLKCNLRCTHCGSACEPTSPVRELTTEEMLGILQTIAEDFDTTRMAVAITGGEPLMRADLFQIMAQMQKLGMLTGIVTNATLMTPDKAARLLDVGMRTTSISLDGPEEVHDVVRGEGTFRKTVNGIGVARRAGIPLVEAITCVRPANVDLLDETERVVRNSGATNWRLITIDRMGRVAGEANPEFWLDAAQVRTLLDFIERRRAETEKQKDPFDIRFSCGGFLGVRREHTVRPGDGQCFAGLCVASILADGKVSACPSLPRSWAQGSALEDRLSTIWRTRFKDFRDLSWRKTGICEKCTWWSMCLGGGLHERLAQPDCFCWMQRQGWTPGT
jgi:radical SAM protein with 4Fe4S-binding SPASM domain